jgi:hypothetical protein
VPPITPEQARAYLDRWRVERVPALSAALADVGKWLEAADIQAAIVGGVAASLLGRPRSTRNIDVLAILPETEWEAALDAAARHGIVPRTERPLEAARRSAMLLLRHGESAIDIDVILGSLRFERGAVEHAQDHNAGGVTIRLPRVEDLLIMKALAHRPQDMQDIEGLLDAHTDVDIDAVRRGVSEFATAAAMPALIDDLERVLERRKPAGAQPASARAGVRATALICRAIRGRLLLEFQYKGRLRVVAPYCHGISTRGLEVLRGIQVGGSGGGGSKVGKLWALEEMVDVRVTDSAYTPDDPQNNPNDTAMKKIHCRV